MTSDDESNHLFFPPTRSIKSFPPPSRLFRAYSLPSPPFVPAAFSPHFGAIMRIFRFTHLLSLLYSLYLTCFTP